MLKKLLWIFLALLLLLGSYFLLRPFWRLPFDAVSPYKAVSADSELLIQLPYLRQQDSAQLQQAHIWYLETISLLDLVDEVTDGEKIEWEDWWLLPENGRTNAEVVYTFIGTSKSLNKAWNPANYGPTLSYGGGEIYTYQISGDDPLYFARYHNLLIIGRFPFQLETALQTVQGDGPSWTDTEGFDKLLKRPAENTESDYSIIQKNSTQSNLPPRWQYPIKPWSTTSETWSQWWLDSRDSLLRLQSVQEAGPTVALGQHNAKNWPLVPAVTQQALPLTIASITSAPTRWEEEITPWLGTGGWELKLSQEPRELWILPVADSTKYAGFTQKVIKDQLLDQTNYQLFELYQLQASGAFAALSDRQHWQPWICELPEALIVGVFREDVERYLDYYLRGASLVAKPSFTPLLGHLPADDQLKTMAYGQWEPLADGEDNLWTLLYPDAPWASEAQWLWQSSRNNGNLWEGNAVLAPAPRGNQPRLAWTVPLASEQLRLLPVWDIEQSEGLRGVVVQSKTGRLWYFDPSGQLYWQQERMAPLRLPLYQQVYPGGLQHLLGVSENGWQVWDTNGEALSTSNNELQTAPESQFVTRLNAGAIAAAGKDSIHVLLAQGQALGSFPIAHLPDSMPAFSLAALIQPGAELLAQFRLGQGWWLYRNDGTFIDSLPLMVREIAGAPQAFNNELLVASTDGYLHVYTPDGQKKMQRLGRGPLDNCQPASLWGDRQTDILAQRGTLLHLFAANGDEKMQERWQYRLPLVPNRLMAAPPIGVMAMHDKERKIWLLDSQGQLLPGFPLAGESTAILLDNGSAEYQLLTLLDGELCAYTWPK